ncbi:DUF4412 domain-containing protein [bacterium]|nr:DUF4412 domain-containing protein [bacterium]
MAMRLFYFFLTFLFCTNALAGVMLASTESTVGSKGIESRIYLDNVGMRAETNGDTVVIFRKDKGVLWILNNADKTYVELDKNTMTAMTAKMNEAMKMMQDKMAKMSVAERAQMEKAMAENNIPLPNQAPPKMTYTKAGRKEVLGNWTADVYEGSRNGIKVNEIWTIDVGTSGVGVSETAVIADYVKFMKDFLKDMNLGGFTDFVGPGLVSNESYQGFPVKTLAFENGKTTAETQITSIQKQSIPSTQFEIPAGYTKAQANPIGDLDM